jgi:hypothetical protein
MTATVEFIYRFSKHELDVLSEALKILQPWDEKVKEGAPKFYDDLICDIESAEDLIRNILYYHDMGIEKKE